MPEPQIMLRSRLENNCSMQKPSFHGLGVVKLWFATKAYYISCFLSQAQKSIMCKAILSHLPSKEWLSKNCCMNAACVILCIHIIFSCLLVFKFKDRICGIWTGQWRKKLVEFRMQYPFTLDHQITSCIVIGFTHNAKS